MIQESSHKRYGTPISEWIRLHTQRLTDNGSGLWDIVGHIEDFSLDDRASIDFVRRSILALMAAGGRPVVAEENGPNWVETFRYGDKPEDIADAVIAEWLAEGAPLQVEWGRWWFAWPGTPRSG